MTRRARAVGLEGCFGEVLHVLGDDGTRAGADRCGEHVSVVRVGKFEPFDEPFVAGGEAARDGFTHEGSCALELFGCEVGAVGQNRPGHFVEDLVGPSGVEHPSPAQPDQEVPQAGRVEDACIVGSSERHNGVLIVEVEALGLGGELSGCFSPFAVVLAHVGEEVGEPDAAPVSDAPMGDLAVFEEPDQVGPRHDEHVGGLLGGEFCVHRGDCDGVAVGDVCKQFDEMAESTAGDGDAQVGIVGDETHRADVTRMGPLEPVEKIDRFSCFG